MKTKNYRIGTPCHWCQRPMGAVLQNNQKKRDWAASRDHLIPKSRGGAGLPGNQVWAHVRCNELRGNMMPEEWIAWMAANPNRMEW